jgi:hypothetical protein
VVIRRARVSHIRWCALFRPLGLGREALRAAMNEAAAEIAKMRTALGH